MAIEPIPGYDAWRLMDGHEDDREDWPEDGGPIIGIDYTELGIRPERTDGRVQHTCVPIDDPEEDEMTEDEDRPIEDIVLGKCGCNLRVVSGDADFDERTEMLFCVNGSPMLKWTLCPMHANAAKVLAERDRMREALQRADELNAIAFRAIKRPGLYVDDAPSLLLAQARRIKSGLGQEPTAEELFENQPEVQVPVKIKTGGDTAPRPTRHYTAEYKPPTHADRVAEIEEARKKRNGEKD